MTLYALGFAQADIIKPDLVELIVNKGIEMDHVMVEEWWDFLKANCNKPVRLLLNKTNPYTYTLDAQLKIPEIDCVKAVAVVNHNLVGRIATNEVMNLFSAAPQWLIRSFSDRDEALDWLDKLP
jgi:hypothetical protein